MVEVKAAHDDAFLTATSAQVSRYRLVLVTNTRDFVLVGEDTNGQPAKLKTFRLADNSEAFDAIRIDCLNGDKYKTGKVAPDGTPDPSIFSTPGDPVGVQVGTAVTTLVRKANHAPAENVGFRHLWGQAKREVLEETAETAPSALYERIKPVLRLGLPFAPTAVSAE